jgi:hypothetical protein
MKINLPLDGTARHRVRPTSRALFGSEYALEVLLVMAQYDQFYGGGLATLTGCEASYASGLLRRFSDVDLIEALRADPGQVRKYFRTLPSPIWTAAVALAAALLEQPEADVARLTSRV